jgi:DNA polymerase elongation subunit (family B)
MKVVYGHTDSIYCTVDSIEAAKAACTKISDGVQKLFPNVFEWEEHPVQLEFEKFFDSLGVGSTKNRNAGLISWKDGFSLDEKEFVMTGFTAKRVSETKLSKDVQISTLKKWINGESREHISDYLNDLYTKVISGHESVDTKSLVKRSRYRPERFQVKCSNCNRKNTLVKLSKAICCNKMNIQTLSGKRPTVSAGVEGVLYHNITNSPPIEDSYLFIKVKNMGVTYTHPINRNIVEPSYFSALSMSEIEGLGRDKIDWRYYANTVSK